MTIVLLVVAGLVSGFEPGDACIDALHQLRTEERLAIVASDVLEDNVVAYTLSDGPRRAEKTALLICQREVTALGDENDPASAEDLEPEVFEPIPAEGDGTGTPDDPGVVPDSTEEQPVVQ